MGVLKKILSLRNMLLYKKIGVFMTFRLKLFFAGLILIFSLSGCWKKISEYPERSVLQFTKSKDEIIDSMNVFHKLILKISNKENRIIEPIRDIYSNLYTDMIFLKVRKMLQNHFIQMNKDKLFRNLSKSELERFKNLIIYLDAENIDTDYYYRKIDIMEYGYRELLDYGDPAAGYYDYREIVLIDTTSMDSAQAAFMKRHKIYDSYKNMYLIGNK
jgi:hypothetical protein